MPPLLTTLDGRFPIACHEHVAALYRGVEAAFRFTPFLDEGLASGDYCVIVADENFAHEMLNRLRSIRPGLDDFLNSRQLNFDHGAADLTRMRGRLQNAFAESERADAPALRWLEQAGWKDAVGLPQAQYFEFHALINLQVKHYPSAAICQFPLDSLDALALCSVITVHRHLIIENTFVRDNPFYVPPEKFLSQGEKERYQQAEKALREVGFETDKLLAALEGYGKLHPESAP
jgi:MEDS: MEthanogen/methylotroph, DcmR Sensory domain